MSDKPFPAGRVPVIRDIVHLNDLLDNAASDRDLLAIRRQLEKQGLSTDFPAFEGLKRGGAAQADDANALTREDWDAVVEWWRRQQHPGTWYTQPQIKGRPPRNSFTLPDDVVDLLGGGDPRVSGMVLAHLFGLRPYTGEDDPRVIDPDVVLHIGHGSLAKGRKVLERLAQMVPRREREGPVLEHDGGDNADGHGWTVRR